MDKRLKVIQVVFNLADPFQEQLYQHVLRHSNQSGYVKRIIQRDMDSVVIPVVVHRGNNLEFDANGFI